MIRLCTGYRGFNSGYRFAIAGLHERQKSANSGQKQPGSSELKTGAIHLV